MPTYVVLSKKDGKENEVLAFDDVDDNAAKTNYLRKVPNYYQSDVWQLFYRRSNLESMHYFPRMARPQIGHDSYINMLGPGPLFQMAENADLPLPHDTQVLASSLSQLAILVDNLEDVFRVIEPVKENMQTHGKLIRNTLLLASMEFEAECRGVLRENAYQACLMNGRTSTKDYVKLASPMRLSEYTVNLSLYPGAGHRQPFQTWRADAPTQSLYWYDAYNATKHDRDANFCRSTLEAAIDAVCACAIMLAAEYRIIPGWRDKIGEFFHFKESPQWMPEEKYVFFGNGQDWTSINYNF